MSKNIKIKQYGIVTLLVIVSVVLVGLIYTSTSGKDDDSLAFEADTYETSPVVEDIEIAQETSDENEVKDDNVVVVEPIDMTQDEVVEVEVSEELEGEIVNNDPDRIDENEAEVIMVETIEEPKAEEPEQPEETPPEEQPETDDDLTNPDVVPEYDEEEVTYTPEVEEEEPLDEVRGSNQVPDSENPFLHDNIPGNGDGGEMQGEDYYENGVPAGEGDKF